MNDMIRMEGGQEAICVKTIHPVIGQKFLIPKVKKEGNVKKTNDKNRFILIKEIVEKNEIVDISKRTTYLAQ